MVVDWRSLFDHIRVPWIDRGANTSPGNVNIKCPFCSDDPSHHLSISEAKQAYYCYRNPQAHSGVSMSRLFSALEVTWDDASSLLATYRADRKVKPERPAVAYPDLEKLWESFPSAVQSPRVTRYLERRGFPDPERLARIYDLRFAENGEWAGRALIPFRDLAGNLLAWSGRALHNNLVPRYKMPLLKERQSPIYLPRFPRKKLVIVEGPIDALKGSVATETTDYSFVALAGLALNPFKLMQLKLIGEYVEEVFLALDAEVKMNVCLQVRYEIKQAFSGKRISRLPILAGYDDPGDIPIEEFSNWLVFLS